MFSVTVALIAIVGIALTNLFLGFASAMLLGRGPKSWSDVDNAVTVRFFAPRLAFPRARRNAEQDKATTAGGSQDARLARSPGSEESASPRSATHTPSGDGDEKLFFNASTHKPPASPSQCKAWDATTKKLVLAPKASPPPADEGPPEALFARQIEAWKASESHEETPCLSGIMITVENTALDEPTRTLLLSAVQASITRQLRKDRRVLRITDNQFVWFSPDVHPDDGLAPVERTRQILCQTRFMHNGDALAVTVQAALVAVSPWEDPPALIQRVARTLQYALEKGDGPTCVDRGHGPEFVQPAKLDLDEVECVLQ
jgi:hypothetical protein